MQGRRGEESLVMPVMIQMPGALCAAACCSCGLIALHGTKGLSTLHVWSNSKPAALGNNIYAGKRAYWMDSLFG